MTGPGVHTLEVPPGAAVQRVDRYVADVTGLSRSHVQKLISAGNLTADGVPLKSNAVIGPGAALRLVVPEPEVAHRILLLNTEKAHNLREKALEVIRMYRELAQLEEAGEETYALEFEEPALITLGLCYEERPRFSGGAYHPVLKRVEEFLKKN